MKKRKIFLMTTGLVMVAMVALSSANCAAPTPVPAPVPRAEFQEFQTEVREELNKMDSRVTSMETEVRGIKEEMNAGFSEVKSGFADVQRDIKDLSKDLSQQQPYPYPYYSPPYPYPYPYYPPYVVPSPAYPDRFTYYFEPGYYRFTIEFEGRVKLYVDEVSRLKAWSSYYRRATHRTSVIYLSGNTEVRVECAEGMVYRLTWQRTDDP